MDLEVDILVDLSLWTAYNKLKVLKQHPAPINMAYLGMGSGSGEWNDYLLTDKVVTNENGKDVYLENLAFFPISYHMADHSFMSPLYWKYDAETGHENTTHPSFEGTKSNLWLCNYAGLQKIDPSIIEVWLNILSRTSNTSLVLREFNSDHVSLMKERAKSRQIDPKRIVYHQYFPANHIQFKSRCDLALDTYFHNGHSGTLDMAWAGVPIITAPSEYIAGRVTASVLSTMQVQETIARDLKEYEEIAIQLAHDSEKLKEIRIKMEKARLQSPMFDVEKRVKMIENGFSQAFQRWLDGENPTQMEMQHPDDDFQITWPPLHWSHKREL